MLATVTAGVIVPAAFVAQAASATIYLGSANSGQPNNATDPHGGIWLRGTTDGTTNGPMDSSTTAPTSGTLTGGAQATTPPAAGFSFGHLWETDVVSGICRVDTVTDPNNSAATIQLLARPGAYTGSPASGGCIVAGQKDSQPTLDPRRNSDGTFFIYTCDWAVFSQGCWRITYDPGKQIMTKTELLAPGRFPTAGGRGIKPFSTNLGADGNLYVTSDSTPYVYQITKPNQSTNSQRVSIVSGDVTNARIRAATFACWDPFRGGTTGLPSCAQSKAAGNPAPDLVLTEKTTVSVLMNVASCTGVAVDGATGGPLATPPCLPLAADLLVATPMGAQTQGAWNQVVDSKGLPNWGPALDPNVIYISDSPGNVTSLVRYTINKDTQDSYSNFGVFQDGTIAQYSFGFSPTQSPDGRTFLADDPSAGGTAFNGHIWFIPPGAAPDALGAPGAPATTPGLPALHTGKMYGSGTSLPNDGIWLPGALGGHLWMSDGAAGFCRMDANTAAGAPAPFALNAATCDITTPKPGQPVYDPKAQADGTHFVYLPDQSTKSVGIVRVKFNPATETIVPGSGVPVAAGQGLENQKASGAALEPTSGNLYVGFMSRSTAVVAQIARVHNPDSANPTVDFVADDSRHKPVFNLDFIGGDLYVGTNLGLDLLADADGCAPGECITVNLLNIAGPKGMASDGVDHIYMAPLTEAAGCPPTCPAPGTLHTPVQVYTVSTGDFDVYSTQGTLGDGTTLDTYDTIDSLTLDPSGNLFIGDDPNVLGLPAGQGRVFEVVNAAQEPLPALVSRPTNPTNQNKPFFSFQSADTGATFRCSLVKSGAADSFQNCGQTANGTVTYGTDGTGAIVQDGANVLPDGAYVFKVEGTGAAGTSPAQAYGFTIDTVAPTLTIDSAAATPTNKNTPSYSFSSTDTTATFACSLTPSSGLDQFQQCTSPISYSAQADGSYTFKVTATDSAGNKTTATAPLVIDTVAPTVSASPAGGVFTTTQTVTLTASEPSTIFYTTDGTTPTTATTTSGASPVTVSVPGSLTLKYIAQDPAGNVGAVASQTYQVGAVVISQNPPSLSSANAPTFAWTDTAAQTYTCSLVLQSAPDVFSACGSATASTSGSKTYTAQPDGDYRFVVQDGGNSQAAFLFTIDTTAPVLHIDQNPQNPQTSSSATFAFSSNEAGTTFQCSFGLSSASPAFSACTSPITYKSLVNNSTYTFEVMGTDKAGNTSGASSYSFSVQTGTNVATTAPTQTLAGLTTAQTGTSATTTNAGPITASTNAVPVMISWTGSACTSGVLNCNIAKYHLQESINGNGFTDVTLPSLTATSVTLNLKPSPINNSVPATTYKFQVQATDTAGNLSTFAIGPTFTVPDTDSSFSSSFNGSWSGVNISSAFGGSVQESTTANATANPANAAPATSLALVSTMGPDRGKAQIKIDGQVVATVDLFASSQQTAQVVWAINGLAPGVTHNLQVVSTGTKNISSSAAKVDYDAVLALK